MRLYDLESALGDVSGFENPILELEQYSTSPHLGAQVIFTMHSTFDDVSGKLICDLGCGAGMLAIAAAILGAQFVVAVDIDECALSTAAQNARKMEVEEIVDFVHANVTADDHAAFKNTGRNFDIVVMNPPFGTKRKGVDITFLYSAVMLADHAVYSMHKSSTRQYIQKVATSYWGVKAQVLAELKFDVGRMYNFHKSSSVDVEVDLWRLDTTSKPQIIVPIARPLQSVEEVRTRLKSSRQHGSAKSKGSVGRRKQQGRN